MPEAEFSFLKSSVPFFTWVHHFWLFGQALPFILRYFSSLLKDSFAVSFVQRYSSLHITKIMWGILCYFGKRKTTLWDLRSVNACSLVTRHSSGICKQGDCIPLFPRCRKKANGLYLPAICFYSFHALVKEEQIGRTWFAWHTQQNISCGMTRKVLRKK